MSTEGVTYSNCARDAEVLGATEQIRGKPLPRIGRCIARAAVAAQIHSDDMPVLRQLFRHLVPTTRVKAIGMHHQNLLRANIAAVEDAQAHVIHIKEMLPVVSRQSDFSSPKTLQFRRTAPKALHSRIARSISSAPLDNVTSKIVSDESERLILVDAADQVLGHLDKSACHDGEGVLHRAFSLFIFNAAGELLIQQRASSKRLWPDFWSNSCCSHPRAGETMELAVQRRCEQELGFRTPLRFLYKFEYSAQFEELGSEHELCSVYVGTFQGGPRVNTTEIKAWRWIAPAELEQELQSQPQLFTPWFKLEWQRLREEFADGMVRV